MNAATASCRFVLLNLYLFSLSSNAADCLIEPTQIVDLASPVTGLLDKVMVRRADRVSKGQVLATFESRAEQAASELARFKSVQVGPSQMAESKIEFAKPRITVRVALPRSLLIPMTMASSSVRQALTGFL